MKKKAVLILGCMIVLSGLIFAAVRTTRESIYKQRKDMLAEAIVLAVTEQINVLRVKDGLPELIIEDMERDIEAKLASLPEYEYVKEGETRFRERGKVK